MLVSILLCKRGVLAYYYFGKLISRKGEKTMKMSKRILALVATLVMVATMFSCAISASASGNLAKIGDTEYATLQAAHDAAKAGDTIVMLGDVDVYLKVQKDIILDLNGYTLSSANGGGDVITLENGNITVYDNSEAKTGKVLSSYNNDKNEYEPTLIWSKNSKKKATIYGGYWTTNADVNPNGGNLFGANVIIYGGKFAYDKTSAYHKRIFCTDYSVTLYGGNFNDNSYTLPSGYTYDEQEDGTWDVILETNPDNLLAGYETEYFSKFYDYSGTFYFKDKVDANGVYQKWAVKGYNDGSFVQEDGRTVVTTNTTNLYLTTVDDYYLDGGFTFTIGNSSDYIVENYIEAYSFGDLKFQTVGTGNGCRYELYDRNNLIAYANYTTSLVKYPVKTITLANGMLTVSTDKSPFNTTSWTLADGTDGGTSIDVSNVNMSGKVVIFKNDQGAVGNQYPFWGFSLTGKLLYQTVAEFNLYLANIDPNDEAAVAKGTSLRALAASISPLVDEALVEVASGGIECTEHNYKYAGTTATCTEDGESIYACEYCGASYTEADTATGHQYSYTTTATCTEDGTRTYVCDKCDDTYTEAEAAFGHVEDAKTENYVETVTCLTCKDTISKTYLGRDTKYKLTSADLNLKNTFTFSSLEFYVGDDVTPDGAVTGQTFTYTMDGIDVTGTINDISFELNGSLVHRVTGVAYTFTEAGKYYIYGTLTNVTDADGKAYPDQKVQMGVIKVRDFIFVDAPKRSGVIAYGDNGDPSTPVSLDNVVLGKTSTNAFGLTVNDVVTDTLYYGDQIRANGWWQDYTNYQITIDGVLYRGKVTRITYKNAYTGKEYGVGSEWNANAGGNNIYWRSINETGVWYLYGQIEGVTSVEGGTSYGSYLYNIPLGTINVVTYQGDTHIHDYDGKATKEPTCTETGIMHYTCECGEDDYYEDIAALGHNYGSEVTTEPTCKETGIETFTCTRCGDVYTETLDVVDHDYVAGYCRFCGIREIYTPTAAQWALKFVDADGNVINNVTTANGEFWMVVSLTDYADLIGNMNKVTADGATDTINSTYDRTIAFATTLISMDGTKVVGVRENGKIVYSTPYDGATIISNYDAKDGLLKVVFQSDNNAGCDFSVGAADLAAKDGELFRIKLTSTLEEAGEFDIKVVEQSALVSSSVALVNKPTAGAWETGISYSSALEFDVRGYDTIYNMAVEVEETPAEPVYDEAFKPASANVVFESDYTIRFTVKTAVYNKYKNVYLVVEKEMFDGDTAIDPQIIELTETATVTVNGEERYAYIVEGFAAPEIASEVTATLYGEDENGNVVYGKAVNYSLRQYAANQIKSANSSAEFKTMMVDFLNYGAAAQTYFGYNTTDLANNGLTEEQLALGTVDRELVSALARTDSSSTRAKFSSANLEFESKITIIAITNINGETYTANKDTWYAEAKYTNYLGEEITLTIPFSDARIGVDAIGRTYINVNELAANEMSTPVEFTVYDGDGAAVTNTLTYSIETYAAGKVNGTNANLAALVKAMMKFGDSARVYRKG